MTPSPSGTSDDLLAAASELYALAPGEFIASRNSRAKAAQASGNKELAADIRGLAKPSTAAWVVNMLVRHRPDDIDRILDLGAELRLAQRELDQKALRELGAQRRKLLTAAAETSRELAESLGSPVSAPIAGDVEETLRSATADAWAAAAVRTGMLVRSLSADGLATVDLAGAVAVPGAVSGALTDSAADAGTDTGTTAEEGPAGGAGEQDGQGAGEQDPRSAAALHRKKQAEAQQRARADLRAAEEAARDAEAASADAGRRLEAVRGRREKLSDEMDELQQRLADLERDIAAAARDETKLKREADRAARAAEDAAGEADDARERLAELVSEDDAGH